MEEKKDEFVGFKCSVEQKAVYRQDARRAGMRLSEYVREALDDKAKRKPRRPEDEAALLSAVRGDRRLSLLLLRLASSASFDVRVRSLLRSVVALLPAETAAGPAPKAPQRKVVGDAEKRERE